MLRAKMNKIMIILVKIRRKLINGTNTLFWASQNKNAIKDYLFDKKYIFAAVTKTFYNVRHRNKSKENHS
jgi:hypothetical protein